MSFVTALLKRFIWPMVRGYLGWIAGAALIFTVAAFLVNNRIDRAVDLSTNNQQAQVTVDTTATIERTQKGVEDIRRNARTADDIKCMLAIRGELRDRRGLSGCEAIFPNYSW